MPLHTFPLLRDNTRLIRFKETLYKVKVHYEVDTFKSKTVNFTETEAHDEIEQVFRAVLYMSERNHELKPILSLNFIIIPRKTPWSFPQKYSNYVFQQDGKSLRSFPFLFEFTVSKRNDIQHNRSETKETISRKSVTESSKSKVLDVTDSTKNYEVYRKNVPATSDNEIKKTSQTKKLITVANVDSSDKDQAPRFGRTKDGRLYRLVDVNAIVQQSNQLNNNNTTVRTSFDQTMTVGRSDTLKQFKDGPVHMAQTEKRESKLSKLTVQNKARRRRNINKIIDRKLKQSSSPHTLRKGTDRLKYTDTETEAGEDSEVEHIRETRALRSHRQSEKRKTQTELIDVNDYSRVNHRRNNKKHSREDSADYSSQKDSEVDDNKDTRKARSRKKSERSYTQTELINVNDYSRVSRRRNNKKHSREDSADSSSQKDSEVDGNKDTRTARSRRKSERSGHIVKDENINLNRSSKANIINTRDKKENRDDSVEIRFHDESDIETKKSTRKRRSRRPENRNKMSDSQTDKEIGAGTRHTRNSNNNNNAESESQDSGQESEPVAKKKKLRRSTRASAQGASNDSQSTGMESEEERQQPRQRTATVQGESSQESVNSRTRHHKLYVTRQSPHIVLASGVKSAELSNPQVSTVRPVKRDNLYHTTHTPLPHDRLRSPRQPDLISSNRLTRQTIHEDETRRIERMRGERPTETYREILLAQGRDRHLVEQAERAETDKLRQLYQPTVPRGSPTHQPYTSTRRRSSGIWGKIMDNLVTPTKRFMKWN